MIASRPMSIAAAVATVAAVMSVAMTRPAHGAGVAPSHRRAAMEIVTPGHNAAADALRCASFETRSASAPQDEVDLDVPAITYLILRSAIGASRRTQDRRASDFQNGF
jgi:hypothetical protein